MKPPDRPHVASLFSLFGTTSRHLTTFDVPPLDSPGVSEATVYIRRGDQVEIQFGSLDDRNKGKTPLEEYTAPGIAVEWLEVEGPLPEPAGYPTVAYRALFGDLPIVPWEESSGLKRPSRPIIVQGNGKRVRFEPDKRALPFRVDPGEDPETTARRLLLDFMRRAFRRPVPEGEVERYLSLVRPKLEAKLCFQEAIRPGFKAILCSPDFLFFEEGDAAGSLDGFALASRLSYFLWRSMPDKRLLEQAEKDPSAIPGEVDRMLKDAKAERFLEDFTGQWLSLRKINETQPDEQLYPEFDPLVQDAMVAETRAFVREMIEKDLGVAHLIDSDFTYANAPLARIYGLEGIEGVGLQRVSLPANSVRGGVLTHGSILKVTANGTTTSPVVRGVWVLEHLLGSPGAASSSRRARDRARHPGRGDDPRAAREAQFDGVLRALPFEDRRSGIRAGELRSDRRLPYALPVAGARRPDEGGGAGLQGALQARAGG